MTRTSKHGQVPHTRRRALGRVRVDVYLSAAAGAILDALAKVHGTRTRALEMLLVRAGIKR